MALIVAIRAVLSYLGIRSEVLKEIAAGLERQTVDSRRALLDHESALGTKKCIKCPKLAAISLMDGPPMGIV
jgi:hypothetical protein